MNLTLNQFEVLVHIEREQNQKHTQRDLAKCINMSLGVINKVLTELIQLELVQAHEKSFYTVTKKGYESLEPYRVKKAIFMAAGFGSRLMPITLNTPKPLILVHGKRIIETLLDAVIAAGIEDITIVRGYLGEQFNNLLSKYPNIKFIENGLYNEANNISSAYLIKDMLENAYVLESDLLLYNPKIIRKYEYSSNYLGMKVDVTDDWCFYMKSGYISKLAIGGTDCYHMFGISYWNKEDAAKMSVDIETVFKKPGGRKRYWDEVALCDYIDNYKILIKQVHKEDIIEIDTLNELKQIDPVYDI